MKNVEILGHLIFAFLFIIFITRFIKFKVDYRLIFIGALLPDIIDKPIGRYIFVDIFENGRIFGHTLLFFLAITFIAAYLYKRNRYLGLFSLSCGILSHLIADGMLFDPRTFFWPLFGPSFIRGHDLGDYTTYIINIYTRYPLFTIVYVAIGFLLVCLLVYYYRLYIPEKLKNFVFKGSLERSQINTISNDSQKPVIRKNV